MLKRLLLFLLVVIAAFAAFVAWGSRGTLDESELATITTYDAVVPPPADTFTVMTYNLGYLSGLTNNRAITRTEAMFDANLEAAARMLDSLDADFIAFQEIDLGANRSFGVQQVDELAERGGYFAAATAVNWDERYVPFPGALYDPSDHFGQMRSGQAVLSRYPILEHHRVVLPPLTDIPWLPAFLDPLGTRFFIDRLAQVVIVDVGQPLVLINVHLEAWGAALREQQAVVVRDLVQQYAPTYPVLLLGDFNTPLPLDPAEQTLPTLLADGILREAFSDTLASLPGTFPADNPRYKIDHLFYEPADVQVVDAFVIGGTPQPSDHRAVAVRLVLPTDSSTVD